MGLSGITACSTIMFQFFDFSLLEVNVCKIKHGKTLGKELVLVILTAAALFSGI